MSTHNDTTKRPGILRWLRDVLDRMNDSAERRANMRELRGLSDHLLRDIGFDPSDVAAGLRQSGGHRLHAGTPVSPKAQPVVVRPASSKKSNVYMLPGAKDGAAGCVHGSPKSCGCY